MKTFLTLFFSLFLHVSCSVLFAQTWDPTFTTPHRSLIDSGHAVVMSIVSDGSGNLYIFDTTYNSLSSDQSSLYAFDVSSWDSAHFTIPSNGHTYWWIPFDTTFPPTSLGNGGGSGGVRCICHLSEAGGSGGCYPHNSCFTAPCWSCVNPNQGWWNNN